MSNTQSGWRAKTSLFEKKSVERTINGTTWAFYPVSVSRLFQLRETIKNIVGSCSILFGSNKDDCGQQIEKITSGDGEIQRTNVEAIQPALAKLRAEQRQQGLRDAIDSLLGDQNRLALGRLLADSLRDEFPRNPKDEEINEFLESLDLAAMVEMLMGFAEANAKVLGPLGEKMRGALRSKLEELTRSDAQSGDVPAAPNTPAS